jgi:hypothetical protein
VVIRLSPMILRAAMTLAIVALAAESTIWVHSLVAVSPITGFLKIVNLLMAIAAAPICGLAMLSRPLGRRGGRSLPLHGWRLVAASLLVLPLYIASAGGASCSPGSPCSFSASGPARQGRNGSTRK